MDFLSFAKFYVLQEIVNVGLVWFAVVGVAFSIIGVLYYIRIVKLMYFDRPLDMSPLRPSFDMHLAISANGLAILALGVYPGALVVLCASALG